MQGTFDNSLTNAMTVSLMLEDALAMNVAVVFTGDEEEDSNGAADVAAFFRKLHKKIKVTGKTHAQQKLNLLLSCFCYFFSKVFFFFS